MGTKHSAEEMLAAAIRVAEESGLAAVTYGRVAQRLGTSDRMVVYYFPTKVALVGGVLDDVGRRLQDTLSSAFTAAAEDHLQVARVAWPVMSHPDTECAFRLFFEALGLSAARREPFDTVVPAVLESWVTWLVGVLTGAHTRRRREAEAAIALLDGLLVVRETLGPRAASRAARALGVTS